MSRGTTFSYRPHRRCLYLFFCNGEVPERLTHAANLLLQFDRSAQKLPSAPANPDRLSADEPSSLLAHSTYSSFSLPFSDVPYLNEGPAVCQAVFSAFSPSSFSPASPDTLQILQAPLLPAPVRTYLHHTASEDRSDPSSSHRLRTSCTSPRFQALLQEFCC